MPLYNSLENYLERSFIQFLATEIKKYCDSNITISVANICELDKSFNPTGKLEVAVTGKDSAQ